jgi:hypothetical protein
MPKTEVFEHGNIVLCDLCNEDFTTSDEQGGFLFESKAVCPHCASKFLQDVRANNEESYIRAVAAPGQSFRDFVVNTLRGGQPARMTITSFKPGEDMMEFLRKQGEGR